MNKRKIINDPIYGFTTIPDELIYDLIQHPYFQRLRRIKQLGLTDYVYPGATHTRFHHALGALHLMTLAIDVLRSKDVEITDKEMQAAQIAILLHDIGHSPYSHALEKKLIPWPHEKISLAYMQLLNEEFEGRLSAAIQIFTNKHPKKFLYQLVSSQLDVDRMDYLNRDSFFTGVAEGIIGYERIIKMLNVASNQLVVEEKGIYSIEKFLHSRRIMYWQVYLHKTVLSAEKMLVYWLDELLKSPDLKKEHRPFYELKSANPKNFKKMITLYSNIDDIDITFALKNSLNFSNKILKNLAYGLLNRKLFKCEMSNRPFSKTYINHKRQFHNYVFTGKETNEAYNKELNEIMVLFKNNKLKPLSKIDGFNFHVKPESKYFIIFQ